MHISHQINHKLMHKQIALNGKHLFFSITPPEIRFDEGKSGKLGNVKNFKRLMSRWADWLHPADCHLNIPGVIDAQSFWFPPLCQRIEFAKDPHVSSAPSPSHPPTSLSHSIYGCPPFLMGKINVNFYAWFMASHLFFCLGRGGRWRSEPF